MCYLPVPCLNFIIGVGAFVSILVSLGLLARNYLLIDSDRVCKSLKTRHHR